MKKRKEKPSSIFNLKTFLILFAFGIWVYVMMYVADSGESVMDAIISYGGNTIVIISVSYVVLLLFEMFVDIGDTGS